MIVLRGRKIIPHGFKKILLGAEVIYQKDGYEPEIPDIPVIKKLSAPFIRLVEGEEIKKLTAPVISLVEGEILKLVAPVIRLEVIEDGGETPVVPIKLATPVITLEIIEEEEPDEPDIPDVPVVEKLDAPIIRIETIETEPDEPDEPEIPEIKKLDTPVITLEIIEEEEPDVPVVTKLGTPSIELVEEEEEPLTITLDGHYLSVNREPKGAYYILASESLSAGIVVEIDGVTYALIGGSNKNPIYLPEALSSRVPKGEVELWVTENTRISNPVTYNVEFFKLDAPKDIYLSGSILDRPDAFFWNDTLLGWSKSEGSDGYTIYYRKAGEGRFYILGGTEGETSTQFDITDWISRVEPGKYEIFVIANDYEGPNSEPSNTIPYEKKIPAPPQLTKSANWLFWSHVEGAEYYGITYWPAGFEDEFVMVDGIEYFAATYDLTNFLEKLATGEYCFAVYATNVTENWSTGFSNPVTYIVE